jgi:uncharacterized protein YjbI with pentapeptide repeats
MSDEETFVCYCGDWRFKNAFFVIDDIRKDVCRDLPFYGEIDGKKYCVLHYPNKKKANDFKVVFQERIDNGSWDFRMVYFPESIEHESKEFHINADFAHATFAEGISFKYCKFFARFDFFDARFLEDAFFTYSEFFKQVNFNGVEFQEHVVFAGVIFQKESYPSFNRTKFKSGSFGSSRFYNEAKFSGAVFQEHADFAHAQFFSKADFKNISLPQKRKTDFNSVKFYDSVNFENVEFYETDFSRARFALSSSSAFNQIDFNHCKFHKTVSFVEAEFHKVADFSDTHFQNVHFENAMFADMATFRESLFLEDVFFNDTKFGYKDERRVKSSQAVFDGAVFGKDSRVFFDNTWFSWHTSFDYVKFEGYVFFKGSKENLVFDTVFENHAFWSLLKILNATFEKPEKVYFESVRLRPSWFVNITFELRKFNFTNIEWSDENGSFITIEGELKNIEKLIKHNSKRLLAIVFRQLAENAETNNRFEEASMFRRMAMKTEWFEKKERLRSRITNLVPESEKLKRRFGDVVVGNPIKEEDKPSSPTNSFDIIRKSDGFFIHWLYRITSYYGESWAWALTVLLLIILVLFPIIYTQTNFQICPKEKPLALSLNVCESKDEEVKKGCECRKGGLGYGEAIAHSLTTATLQSVDYRKPITSKGEIVIVLERIFAPLQAALLALALRRKFMR